MFPTFGSQFCSVPDPAGRFRSAPAPASTTTQSDRPTSIWPWLVVYLNGGDPKHGTRARQDLMDDIVEQKTGETRRRLEVTIKDKNLDCIRNLPVSD